MPARGRRHSPGITPGIGIAREMLLDFPDRISGQILVNLGNDAGFHVGMECVSQFGQRSWRSNHHEGFHLAAPGPPVPWQRDLPREMMLLDIVPIGRLDRASRPVRSLANMPGPAGALPWLGRIVILENPSRS